jgi:hypothetical protein
MSKQNWSNSWLQNTIQKMMFKQYPPKKLGKPIETGDSKVQTRSSCSSCGVGKHAARSFNGNETWVPNHTKLWGTRSGALASMEIQATFKYCQILGCM